MRHGRNLPPKLSIFQHRMRYTGRKGLLALLVLAVLGGLGLADRQGWFGHADQPDLAKYEGKTCRVVHVSDGDTLDVDIPDGSHGHTRIRLWGVDTPESVKPNTPVQHFGREASDFTKKTAMDQMVRLELNPVRTRDKYGRLLAYVYLPDGRMLNRVLVEEGYGYADPRFDHKYKTEFRHLQAQAKSARLGLWKDIKPADLPDYYRDMKLP